MEKRQKRCPYERQGREKNILLMFTLAYFILILMSNFVFADLVQFDNVKSFEPKSITSSGTKLGTITITNFFGLGGDISKITLEKNSDFCLINCYAEGTTVLYSEGRLFDNFNFKDVNSKTIIQQNKILVEYNQNYTIDVDDYKETCGIEAKEKNGTICKSDLVGTHKETRTQTISREYKNGEVLPAGTYHWRIEGKKGLNQNVEWIANSYGLDLNEWAWWNASSSYKSKITITEPNLIDRNVTDKGGWLVNITANFTTGRINSSNEIFVINSAETGELESSVKNITRDGDWITQAEIYFRLDERVAKAGSVDVYIYYDCDTCGTHSYTKNYTNMQIVYQTGTATEYIGWYNYSSITGTTILYQQEAGAGNPAPDFYSAFNSNAYGMLNTYRYFTPTNPKTRVLVDLYHASFGARGASGSTGFKLINATENPSGWGYGGQICAVTTTNAQLSCWGSPETTGMAWTKVNSSTTFLNIMPYNNMTLSLMCRSGSNAVATPAQVCRMDNIIFLEQFDGTFTQGGEEAAPSPPTITLNNPVNYYNSSSNSITFNCSSGDNLMIVNTSLWIDGIRNYTIDNGVSNFTSLQISRTLADGNHAWGCSADDNLNLTGWAVNRTFDIDTSLPVVTVVYPTNTTYTTNYTSNSSVQINLNATYSDTNLQACWIYNGTANATLTCGTNMTITTGYGAYKFIFYANDTFGNLGSAEVSANWVYSVYENTSSYSSSVYETDSEKYQVNFSLYPGTSFISVKLVYNGTEYVVSDITNYGNLVELKKTIDIPLNSQVYTTENKSFFWNFIFSNSFGTINQNSSVKTQSVVPVNVVKCNNTFPTDTVNITIYDELYPTTKLNSSFFATWTFWKGTGTVKKNYSFLNDSNLNYQYKFCINPNQTSVYANLISEITSTGYWDRTHYLYNYTLNNATKEITVLMLNDTIGVKFFHTLRQAVTRISDAIVTISKYDVGTGLWVVVGIRQSDVDGEFVEYLELDKQYSYLVTKNGVALGTILKTSTCSATPCLMDLALGETSVDLWGGYYDSWGENIIYTLNYSKDTHNVTLKFEDTSGLASYFRLIVSKVSGNDSGGILCNRTLYSTVGTIVCGTAGYQGQFVAKAYSSSSPEKPFAFLYGIVQALAEILGKDEGLFFAFLIIVIVGLIGAWNPAVGVLLAGVAFIFAAIMGLIIMSMTSIILIILLIIILVVKMGRNSV